MTEHSVAFILANALILMAVAPCWALVLAIRTWRRAPDLAATRERVILYSILTAIGVGLALVGINFDGEVFAHRNLVPSGLMFVLSVAILAGMDCPAIVFIIGWYRR